MMSHGYTYEAALEAAERVAWRVDDIIGGARQLDFTRPFLPDSLVRATGLSFLNGSEQRSLNHIRAHFYLYFLGLAEEFILPFVLDHVRPMLHDGGVRARALLQFALDEAKHIDMFRRFRLTFAAGFGTPCTVVGPAREVARAVLAHHPLAIALAILQIEWMTQRHYLDSVREGDGLDRQFRDLLKYHWLEEAQHAKLDTLMLEAIAATCSTHERASMVDGYLRIVGLIDGLLARQVAHDLDSFIDATARDMGAEERLAFTRGQLQALRWTFIGSGMTHPDFLATIEEIRPDARPRVMQIAPTFC
jgi:hypothetical protein